MRWFRRFLANLPSNRRWAIECAMVNFPGAGSRVWIAEANSLLIYRFNL